MDEVKIFQVRISDFLFCDVLPDALEHLSCIYGNKRLEPNSKAALDIQASMALGISRNAVFAGSSTVCLRILQRNAHIYYTRICYYDFIQATFMVCVLSDGNDDAAHMHSQKCDFITERKTKIGYTKDTNKVKEGNQYVSFKRK